jgi:hypothetical protein
MARSNLNGNHRRLRPPRSRNLAIALCFTAALALSARAEAADRDSVPSANSMPAEKFLRVAVLPSSAAIDAFVGEGRAHAVYEIYLANFTGKAIEVLALHAADAGGGHFDRTISGPALEKSFSLAGGDYSKPQRPLLKPAQTGVIFVFLDFDSRDAAPDKIANSVDIEAAGAGNTAQRIDIAPIAVSKTAAVIIHSPLAGANWLAANGPSNTSPHRRAIFVADGLPRIGQRFAIDWLIVGPDGKTYDGDPERNSSYLAYDKPVMAAADGRIVSVLDGLPENIPNSSKLAVELNVRNAGGNNVAEDLGGGRYAMYAHLRPHSITVKPGDRVHAGEVIGHLGNTGSSTEPHLHFQICDAPSFLASNGIPFELDSFTVTDYEIVKKSGTPVKLNLNGSRSVSNEEPMEDQLVSFGSR